MKKRLLTYCIYLITAMLSVSTSSFADEIKFEAVLNNNIVSLGQGLQLRLQFTDSTKVPAPELPDIDGFKSRYSGPSTRMSIVNGRMSSSVTHIYRLVPLKTGKFTVGPFSFEHNGDRYVSNALTVEVVDAASGHRSQQQLRQRVETKLKDKLFLTMKAGKSRLYINEIIPLTIKLYVSGIGIRDIQYPEFSHDGLSSGEFGKPKQYQESRGGIRYDVVEFNTTIFGTKTGELSLGPAKLQANLVIKQQRRRRSSLFDDFFGYSTEPVELDSEMITLEVMPLPQEKRPDSFGGAVGDFDFNIEVSPREVKTGDPLTLKMTITGDGNFSTVTSPKLDAAEDFKVYEPQVKSNKSKKVFEQILIPLSDAVKEIPDVDFSFFNTEKGIYETISRGATAITVTKPEQQEAITIMEASNTTGRPFVKEKLGRDIIYIKESPGRLKAVNDYLYMNPVFLLLHAVPVILFVFARTTQKRKDRLSTDIGYARRLSAPKKARKGINNAERCLGENSTEEFYDSVHKTLREYIGDRFHIPSGGITADIVDEMLKDMGIDGAVLNGLRNIFQECDMARYAPSQLSTINMENTLKGLKEAIDYMERHK
ncbi:MAG: BatD family protein [Nitrospirota bacterium]